ncbi:YfbR-like 5'-deoxynucleotidase [Cellulomonas sp. P4]|uniref:YfbR-like 5'-deoxynucleotidase n=1 Tax=Cellulomonas sp. P4 TaxID=3142533 RepID=UPI0031BB1592
MTTETSPGPTWQRGAWMQTYTGRRFYPMDPAPADVVPIDIAHALGMLCRYNGHVDRFYSVAEHCVLMSEYVEHQHSRELALMALLHDATEAYVGDMIRPLKVHMPEYRAAEDRVMSAIAHHFGLAELIARHNGERPPEVKEADSRILLTERAELMSATHETWDVDDLEPLPVAVHAWDPTTAAARYAQRLDELLAKAPR